MSVKPMVKVQGEEAMHFEARLKTASVFNWFYKVDNLTECYVDPVNLAFQRSYQNNMKALF